MFTQETIDEGIKSALNALKPNLKKLRKIRPVRIFYNGNFIETPSGKTVWKRLGDAKAALRFYFKSYIRGSDFFNVGFDKKTLHFVYICKNGLTYTNKEYEEIVERMYEGALKNVRFVEI